MFPRSVRKQAQAAEVSEENMASRLQLELGLCLAHLSLGTMASRKIKVEIV